MRSDPKAQDTKETIKAPAKAVQKLSTVNPNPSSFPMYPTNQNIIIFKKNNHRPKVIIVIGNVKNLNIGRKMLFKRPATTAMISTWLFSGDVGCMPGNKEIAVK